ncbi:MAG: UTP--glucose-1-phosphate uridylyltransferase [Bacilli bacterium]|nr:UTP--glucose-1-phosphate uridylyltransferase [Bacilli bacterium]
MKKITKAVIPVAGLGTRFLPITKSVPKEMLPIVDKPTLSYIIDECIESGITDILLITSPYKKVIEDYFDQSYELEKRLEEKKKYEELDYINTKPNNINIYFIRQGEPQGSGHAIKLAKTFVGNDSFAVLYGDDIMKAKGKTPALKQLIKIHEKTDSNVIGCLEVPIELAPKYGMIEFKNKKTNEIKTIIEKPKVEDAPSNYAGLGRYIVSSNIFPILENLSKGVGNEYQFTDAMKELMNKEKFYACNLDATYYDTGSKIGYLKANIDYAREREDLKERLEEYLDSITK